MPIKQHEKTIKVLDSIVEISEAANGI